MAKAKIATVWLSGCSGCHMSFLDLDTGIIDVVGLVDITASPITDIKEIPPVDVGIVEGAVANTENVAVLKKLRANSKYIMAWGDCAVFGGLPTLRNMIDLEECLQRGYVTTESTVNGKIPTSPELPKLLKNVLPVNEIVKIDCYVPGCPPEASAIYHAIIELLNGKIPVLPANMMKFD